VSPYGVPSAWITRESPSRKAHPIAAALVVGACVLFIGVGAGEIMKEPAGRSV
jgi:hypothetical protein